MHALGGIQHHENKSWTVEFDYESSLNKTFDHDIIDSLTKDSSLLALVKKQGLKYFLKQHSANYIEVSVLIPYSLFEGILEKAISEDPENIFVFNLLDPTSWDIQLQHSFEELVATGITNLFISISLDENALLISVNKFLIQPQELYRKIKALRFD